MADSEIKNMIESQVQNLVAEHIMSEETQKSNLDEAVSIEFYRPIWLTVNNPQIFFKISYNKLYYEGKWPF